MDSFMVIERLPEIQNLSTEEKWVLVDELWAAILGNQSQPADPTILAELERRMAHYEAHPETATTWESIQARLLAAGPGTFASTAEFVRDLAG